LAKKKVVDARHKAGHDVDGFVLVRFVFYLASCSSVYQDGFSG
jgi:hypothetical protein